MSSFLKNTLIIIVFAAVLYAGYYIFMSNEDASLTITGGTSDGELMATEFLLRLSEIEQISITRDFFDDARVLSLVSFSTSPQSVPAGRPNPFSE